MLLRFSVENFLCFRDEATLSLVATSDDKHASHILSDRAVAAPRILRAAGVYGANGHGKTKLVEAVRILRDLVVEGVDEDEELVPVGFALGESAVPKPTIFTIEFSYDKIDYEYGISLLPSHVEEEWLYGRITKKSFKIFERKTKAYKSGKFSTVVTFGDWLVRNVKKPKSSSSKAFLEFIAEGTRPEENFLHEASLKNVAPLRKVRDWFKRCLVVVTANANYSPLHSRTKNEKAFAESMSNFIKLADTGISGIDVEEVPFDKSGLNRFTAKIRSEILQKLKSGQAVTLQDPAGSIVKVVQDTNGELVTQKLIAIHTSEGGNPVRFPVEMESTGTQRMLNLLPMLVDLVNSKRTYVVDELDRALHPLVAFKFIELFLGQSGGGQLIFTTHNTHLLDLSLLRRDEIWFVQKREFGASELYSLADLKVRPDLDIERGYLNGRFGAIPFLGNLHDLGWYSETASS